MNYAQAAEITRSQGRGDDSMLVHMTPKEVQGIASLAPHRVTTNPETGLPEMGGFEDILPAIVGIGGAMMGLPTWMVGLGTGLTSFATSGNLGQGIASGLLSFGLGELTGSFAEGAAAVANTPAASIPGGATTATGVASAQGFGGAGAGGLGGGGAGGLASAFDPTSALGSLPSSASLAGGSGLAGLPGSTGVALHGGPANFPQPAGSFSDALSGPNASAGLDAALANKTGITSTLFGGAGVLSGLGEENNIPGPAPRRDIPPVLPDPRTINSNPNIRRAGIDPEFQYFSRAANGGMVKMQQGGIVGMSEGGVLADALNPIGAIADKIGGTAGKILDPVGAIGNSIGGEMGSYIDPAGYARRGQRTDTQVAQDKENQRLNDEFNLKHASMRMQEGGIVPQQAPQGQGQMDPLITETMKALMGAHENPEAVVQAFVQKYGPEKLEILKQYVAQMAQQQGGAQPGGLQQGPGGGQDDLISAGLQGRPDDKVMLSDGEFVVPADAVSGLGDGSTNQGGRKLQQMVNNVRKKKNGGIVGLPSKVPNSVMPA